MAPQGNEYWKLRSKHGRDKLFETHQLLWKEACAYFKWCSENPWIKTDYKGKDADKVEIPTARPFTLYGLCLYLGVNTKYFNDFKKTACEDFSEVIRRIEEVIKMQKLEGAMVGAFNANIVARDLGLTDRQEINLDRLTDEQLDQIIEKITGQSNR